ncbi:uncharacterized protein LOC135100010 isoform X2 [Scylla paramamosain]|uniref:uncharacterized protein LOC135100010 isoform X2 n=1 Tax=Scylla paramamosain TaxID=85552 RepID=UPI0030832184
MTTIRQAPASLPASLLRQSRLLLRRRPGGHTSTRMPWIWRRGKARRRKARRRKARRRKSERHTLCRNIHLEHNNGSAISASAIKSTGAEIMCYPGQSPAAAATPPPGHMVNCCTPLTS